MKPFHEDNSLFFFKFYPRTNVSLFFFSGKTGFGLSSTEAYILGTPPFPYPLSLFLDFLEAKVGAGRTGASNPPRVGTLSLGLECRLKPPRVWGI